MTSYLFPGHGYVISVIKESRNTFSRCQQQYVFGKNIKFLATQTYKKTAHIVLYISSECLTMTQLNSYMRICSSVCIWLKGRIWRFASIKLLYSKKAQWSSSSGKKKFEWKKKKTKKNTIRQKSDDKKPSIQSFKKFKKKKIHKARLRCAKKQARPSFPALLLPCYDVIHSLCVLPSPWFSHFNYQQYLMASCLQGSLKETITFIDILLLFSSSSPSLDIMQK